MKAPILAELGLNVVDLRKQGTANPARTNAISGVVIHSPGTTYVEKIAKALGEGAMDQEVLDHAVATDFDGRPYQPGYLVGQTGSVYMLEDDSRCTAHSAQLHSLLNSRDWRCWAWPLGADKAEQHGRDPHVVYDWWDEVHGMKGRPGDLLFERQPNRCIGIDLRPRHEPGEAQFSEAQLVALTLLVWALAKGHAFARDERHVFTHSLADPLRRGSILRRGKTIGVHWDPSSTHFDYADFMARLKED